METDKYFDCNKCGKCCTNIGDNPIYSYLDGGNGVCKHFNKHSRGCNIYDTRPLLCRIDESYDKFFSKNMTRKEFHDLNKKACKSFK